MTCKPSKNNWQSLPKMTGKPRQEWLTNPAKTDRQTSPKMAGISCQIWLVNLAKNDWQTLRKMTGKSHKKWLANLTKSDWQISPKMPSKPSKKWLAALAKNDWQISSKMTGKPRQKWLANLTENKWQISQKKTHKFLIWGTSTAAQSLEMTLFFLVPKIVAFSIYYLEVKWLLISDLRIVYQLVFIALYGKYEIAAQTGLHWSLHLCLSNSQDNNFTFSTPEFLLSRLQVLFPSRFIIPNILFQTISLNFLIETILPKNNSNIFTIFSKLNLQSLVSVFVPCGILNM